MTINDLYEIAHKGRCKSLRVRDETDFICISNAFNDSMLKKYGELKVYDIYTEPFVKDRMVQTRLCAHIYSGDFRKIKGESK